MDYAIFGITQPLEEKEVKTKPLIVGSLTTKENETLECLMDIGISPQSRPKSYSPSASARGERDLQCVKRELRSSLHLASLPAPDPSSFLPEPVEPQPSTSAPVELLQLYPAIETEIKIRCLSADDITAATTRLNKKSKPTKSKRVKKTKQVQKSSKADKPKQARKFCYRCKVANCTSTFNWKKAWNIHHLVKHKTIKYTCDNCKKSICHTMQL